MEFPLSSLLKSGTFNTEVRLRMDTTRIPFEAYKGTDPYIFVSYAHKDSDKVFPIEAFPKLRFLGKQP
jgi:hypothetical protein